MKRVIIAAGVAALMAIPAAEATPVEGSPTFSAYLRVPLDGQNTRWNDPQFGVRLDRLSTLPGASTAAFAGPGIVNVKYRRNGLQAFDLLGVNALAGPSTLAATGNQSGSWTRVGVVVAGGALAMCVAGSAICRRKGQH